MTEYETLTDWLRGAFPSWAELKRLDAEATAELDQAGPVDAELVLLAGIRPLDGKIVHDIVLPAQLCGARMVASYLQIAAGVTERQAQKWRRLLLQAEEQGSGGLWSQELLSDLWTEWADRRLVQWCPLRYALDENDHVWTPMAPKGLRIERTSPC